MQVKIAATGVHLPPRVQSSKELAQLVGRSPAWIESRTGVHNRRISEEPLPALAARAARAALGDGPPPDLVLCAGASAHQLIPDNSVFLMRELGLSGVPGFSVHATCLSFMVGFNTACALVHGGAYRRVLVVSAEQGSRCRDLEDAESAALIGDGAAAAVLAPTPEGESSEVLGSRMGTWPEGAEMAELQGFGSRHHPSDPETTAEQNQFHMRGPRLIRLTLRAATSVLEALQADTGVSLDDVDCVVPHQASRVALDLIPRLGFPKEKVADTGNCVAASLPMALAHAHAQGRLQRGMKVLLLGAGAGVSVGAVLLRW